jgi:hypothetical protein
MLGPGLRLGNCLSDTTTDRTMDTRKLGRSDGRSYRVNRVLVTRHLLRIVHVADDYDCQYPGWQTRPDSVVNQTRRSPICRHSTVADVRFTATSRVHVAEAVADGESERLVAGMKPSIIGALDAVF